MLQYVKDALTIQGKRFIPFFLAAYHLLSSTCRQLASLRVYT